MKRQLFLAVISAIGFSCSQEKKPVNPVALTPADSIKVLNIQPESFEEIDSSGIALFPMSMNESADKNKRSYKDMPNNDNWNILFYNSNTRQYYLLTEEKILVENYYLGNENDYSIVTRPKRMDYIFYTARTEDYNNDKVITGDDPLYLFVSDRAGRNFRQVSPKGYHLSNWQHFRQSDKVILTGISDKNRDSVFAANEEELIFETSLAPGSTPVPVFTPLFLDSLKMNFGKHWHRIR